MKILIFSLFRLRDERLKSLEQEYLSRMQSLIPIEIRELGSLKGIGAPQRALEDEKILLSKLKPQDYLVALDEKGQQLPSKKFATFLEERMQIGSADLIFALSGPDGWCGSLGQRAQMRLSISKMTFTSQVARFLLIEQLYRAACINSGHPYHR